MRPVSHHVRRRAVVERRPCHWHARAGGGNPAADQPGSPGNNGLFPDNQPGSPLNGVGSQSSDSIAGEQIAAVRTTATEPAGRGSGTESGRSPLRNRTAAQERPRIRRADRENSAARGTGNPRCGATEGGGSRGESGGRGDQTGPYPVHGWVTTGRWGGRLLGGVEEGPNLGRGQSAHGQQPGSLRCRVCCACPCPGAGVAEERDPGTSHHLLGCSGSHQPDGIGRTWPGAAVRPPGTEAHRHAAPVQARDRHRSAVLPGAQRSLWLREGR